MIRRICRYTRLLVLLVLFPSAGCTTLSSSPPMPTPYYPTATIQASPVFIPSPSPPLPVFPSPLPTRAGTNLYFSAGCPNPEGVDSTAVLSRGEALEVIRVFYTGDLDQRRQVADPAFWPLLSEVEPLTLEEENLSEPRYARESPFADLLANACSEGILDYSWWIEVCPGSPPPDKFEECPPALRLHFFFIRRGGQWLIWGSG